MEQNASKGRLRVAKLERVFFSLALALSMVPIAPAAAYADEGDGQSGAALVAASSENLTGGASLTTLDANADIWDGSIDVSWYDASKTSFTLTKPAQLAGLAAIVNGTAENIAKDAFTGKTVSLGADITLNATTATGASDNTQRNWTGIGAGALTTFSNGMPSYDDSVYFDGTFDGAGHVVKNIYIYKTNEVAQDGSTGPTYGGYQGLFTSLGSNAVVKNVGVDGGYIYGRVAGGIAAISHADVDSMPQIIGCFNTATIQGNGASTRGTGGIFGGEEQYRGAGNYRAAAYIANCYNTGTIGGAMGSPVGGIAGAGSVKMYSCYNAGAVTSTSSYAGALAGNLIGAGATVGDGSSSVEGAATVRNSYALAGSIAADGNSKVKLYNLIDATHTKDGTGAADAAVESADDAAFKDAAWFASADAQDALSHWSFAQASPSPKLWWQGGDAADLKSLESKDDYGYDVYEIGDIANQAYTGQPITPTVKMAEWSSTANGWVYLREGADFTVAFSDNTDAGTANVAITGMGRFYGSRSTTFKIVNGDLSTAVIEDIPAQWIYGSAKVEPSVTVKAADGSELVEDKDYTLEYKDNDKAGTATVTAKAVEGTAFTGEVSKEFQLVAASESLKGSGTAEAPYQLASKADLQCAAHMINTNQTGYSSAYYKVMESFDASATKDSPIAADWFKTFSGTIDGNGKTITIGLTDDSATDELLDQYSSWNLPKGIAFVDTATDGATFKNLTLAGAVTTAGAGAGFVGGITSGTLTFENCTNAVDVQGDMYYSGGAAGFVYTASANGNAPALVFKGCTNEGSITSSAGSAAGFVNRTNGSVSFTDCENAGDVTSGREQAGGFIAALTGKSYSPTSVVSFLKSANTGSVATSTNSSAGGFVGTVQYAFESLSVAKCYNTGTVDGVTDSGGFFGNYGYNSTSPVGTITNCYNVGEIKAHANSSGSFSGARPPAGFAGEIAGGTLTIENAYTAGVIMAVNDNPKAAFVGQTFTATLNLDNVYYDESTADGVVGYQGWGTFTQNGGADAMNADVMKGSTFVTMLGAAFSSDDEGANDGYPILADREVNDITACTFSPSDIPEQQYTGAEVKPAITVKDTNGATLKENVDYLVFYTVDGTKGTATIMGIGDWEGAKVMEFDVAKCKISSCTVSPLVTKSYIDNPGGTFTQDVVVTNPAGGLMVEGVDYLVSYSGNDRAGTAMVLITGKGDYYEGTALRAFAILPANLADCEVTDVDESYAYSSYGISVSPTITAPNGYVLKNSWSASDFTTSYKDAEGNAYASRNQVKPGMVTVTFTGAGSWIGNQEATVKYGRDLGADFTLVNDGMVVQHTGDVVEFTPELTYEVADYWGTYTRSLNAMEYTTTITNEDGEEITADDVKDPGVYTYTLESTNQIGTHGSYYDDDYYAYIGTFGTVDVTLAIATPGYFIGDDAVTGIEDEYAETGDAIAVEPIVTIDGEPLLAGTNYTVTYADEDGEEVDAPTAAGTYTVTVQGIEPYAGKVVKEFAIAPAWFTVYTQAGSDESSLTPVKVYTENQFRALKSASTDSVSALYSGASWQVLTATEYVTLEDLLDDAGISADWKSGSALLYGGDPTQGKPGQEFDYDTIAAAKFFPKTAGSTIDPSESRNAGFVFALKAAGGTTSKEKDAAAVEAENIANANAAGGYEAAPRNVFGVTEAAYTDADNHSSEVRGMRLWKNLDSIVLKTAPASIAAATVSASPASCTYDGTAKEPAVTVKLGNDTLGTGDYSVEYAANVNAGTATVTVTGQGAYTGTASTTFKIDPASIAAATVSASPASYTYDGTAKEPAVTVKLGVKTLSQGTDYTVAYSGNTEVGTATATVTGKGNYTGAASGTFAITAAPASEDEGVTVYRLYHTTDGEHLYTTSAAERDQILSWGGWDDEGVAWIAPSSGTPVYRLYDRNTGEHFYTASASERATILSWGNWNDEGVKFYSDDAQTVPVYRLQNSANYPHAHHYTLSDAEKSRCINEWGWRDEGIGWYALAAG